jgi:hypothetical protein
MPVLIENDGGHDHTACDQTPGALLDAHSGQAGAQHGDDQDLERRIKTGSAARTGR